MNSRVAVLLINDRCPLRCRHCAVGYSATNQGRADVMESGYACDLLEALALASVRVVLIAGGEPSLEPSIISRIAQCGLHTGVQVGVITAPVWAKTNVSALRFLESIADVSRIVLSLDSFHLEFLDSSYYATAVAACNTRNRAVSAHITYSNEADLSTMKSLCSDWGLGRENITALPVMPFGNAVAMGQEKHTIRSESDLFSLPSRCTAGDMVFSQSGKCFACCWASAISGPSSFVIDLTMTETVEWPMRLLDFQRSLESIRGVGPIRSALRTEFSDIFQYALGQSFSNECELCIGYKSSGLTGRGGKGLTTLKATDISPQTLVSDATRD